MQPRVGVTNNILDSFYIYVKLSIYSKKIVGFYWHLAVYIVINVLIILVIVLNGGPLWHFGTLSTPLFWGVGLLFHFLGVFGPRVFFGKDWEQRKIKEFMDKEESMWE